MVFPKLRTLITCVLIGLSSLSMDLKAQIVFDHPQEISGEILRVDAFKEWPSLGTMSLITFTGAIEIIDGQPIDIGVDETGLVVVKYDQQGTPLTSILYASTSGTIGDAKLMNCIDGVAIKINHTEGITIHYQSGTVSYPGDSEFDCTIIGGAEHPSGFAQRALAFVGPGDDQVCGIALADGEYGDINTVSGPYNDKFVMHSLEEFTSVIGGDSLSTTGSATEVFVVNMDSVGNVNWDYSIGGPENTTGGYADMGSDQNYSMGGQFTQTIDVAGSALTASGSNPDVFVCQFGPFGSLHWAQSFGSPSSVESLADVKVDTGTGSVYITGTFQGTTTFGGFDLSSNGGDDIFVVKLNATTGLPIFANSYGSSMDDKAGDLAVAIDKVFITGSFNSTMTAGSDLLVGDNTDNVNPFLIMIDTTGNTIGGIAPDQLAGGLGLSQSVDAISKDTALFGGIYSGQIAFNGDTLSFGSSYGFRANARLDLITSVQHHSGQSIDFNLYPNPNNGHGYLDLSYWKSPLEIRVTDVSGRVVSTQNYSGANGHTIHHLDLSNEPGGIYLLTLRTGSETLVERLIIAR